MVAWSHEIGIQLTTTTTTSLDQKMLRETQATQQVYVIKRTRPRLGRRSQSNLIVPSQKETNALLLNGARPSFIPVLVSKLFCHATWNAWPRTRDGDAPGLVMWSGQHDFYFGTEKMNDHWYFFFLFSPALLLNYCSQRGRRPAKQERIPNKISAFG